MSDPALPTIKSSGVITSFGMCGHGSWGIHGLSQRRGDKSLRDARRMSILDAGQPSALSAEDNKGGAPANGKRVSIGLRQIVDGKVFFGVDALIASGAQVHSMGLPARL